MAPLKIRLKLPSNPSSESPLVPLAPVSTSTSASASASDTFTPTSRPRLILKHRSSQQNDKVSCSSPYSRDHQDDRSGSKDENEKDEDSEGYTESDGDHAHVDRTTTYNQPPSSDRVRSEEPLADSSDASSEIEPEPMDVDEEGQDQDSNQSKEDEESEDDQEEEDADEDDGENREEATQSTYAHNAIHPSSSRLPPSGSSPVFSQQSTPVTTHSPVPYSSALPTASPTTASATMIKLPKLVIKNTSDAIRTPTSIVLSRPDKPSGSTKKSSRPNLLASSKPIKTTNESYGEHSRKEAKKKKRKEKEIRSTLAPWPPPTEPSPAPPSSSFAPSPDPYAPPTPSFASPSQVPESHQVSETSEPPEELQSYIAPNGTKAFVRAKGANGRKIVGGQLQKPLREVCERLLKEIRRRDDYQFFLNPVSEKEVPGYHSIIKNPMSLSVMDRKLSQGLYQKFDLFEADLRLIFTNCITFNPPSTIFSTTALKLLSWFERHLPTYRELILPESDNKDDSTLRSRSPSVFDEQGEPSPAPSGLADEDGAMTPTGGNGSGQAGRKRGPYKTIGGPVLASTSVTGAVAVGGGAAAGVDKSQAGSFDEEGVLKGAGMFGYDPAVWGVIHWWETGGRRLKNKREVTKLASRGNEYVPCMPDGSRDLSELEHLTPSLDVFLRRPMSIPRLIPLPANFLATNARPMSAEDIASLNPPLPTSNPLPSDDCYLPLTSDELPPAFQAWKLSKSITSTSTSTSTSATAPASDRPFTRPPRDESRTRPTLATDYAPFPLFPLSACTSQSLTEASRASFVESVSAGAKANRESRSSIGKDSVEKAVRTAKEEDWIRDIVYGGQLGEAYARSLERFLEGAIVPTDRDQQGLKHYRDEFLTGTVWAGGGLRYLQDIGLVMRDLREAGGRTREMNPEAQVNGGSHSEAKFDVKNEKTEDSFVKQEREDADLLMGLSGASTSTSASSSTNVLTSTSPSITSPKMDPTLADIRFKIDRVIRDVPLDRKTQAELALIRALPLSLSSLVRDPNDFTREISPRVPKKRKAEEEDDNDDRKEEMSWPENTLKAIGEELMDWIQDGSSRSGTDEDRSDRIRLLLLSLTRRAPLSTIERLGPEDLEILPQGNIRTHFSQIVR